MAFVEHKHNAAVRYRQFYVCDLFNDVIANAIYFITKPRQFPD